MRLGAILPVALLGLALLAGCTQPAADPPVVPDAPRLVPVAERNGLPYNVTGFHSQTLVKGALGMLPVESVYVEVELPATEGGAALLGGGRVHMGLWRPNVPEGTKVPVIADIGPYYGDSDLPAVEPARRLGGFLIENFVPHGYAVAQVSVFGSGLSNHCMDLMGNAEQLGVDAAVTWLGSQEWSNGKVGLVGRSYDGSTPWQAAMFGNEHLATIVPISGLIGMHELMWRNGSAETRGPIMHNYVYGTFGIDGVPDPLDPEGAEADTGELIENLQTLCPDYVAGLPEGAAATVTGDQVVPAVNPYWAERSFLPRALANYKGSVYFIHGLQDWNVDPHMAFPTYQKLEAAGLEVKGLFGQWNHMYPDRPSEHVTARAGEGQEAYPASVRYDWAQDLLEWFDHYLKGSPLKPALHVEVQDNHGGWRIEATYPPTDATPLAIGLDAATTVEPTGIAQPGQPVVSPTEGMVLKFAPLEAETRVAGLPTLHVQVTPTGPGGQLYAELADVAPDGTTLRLGHAIMDLRFAAGGTEAKPVVPGMPLVARMEFEAFDAVVPAGHSLRLELAGFGRDYLPSAVSAPVLVDLSAASVLTLPTVERGPDAFFTPPEWSGEAKATAQQP